MPPKGEYDDKTVRAVAKLQAETASRSTASRQTIRMILSSLLTESPTPFA